MHDNLDQIIVISPIPCPEHRYASLVPRHNNHCLCVFNHYHKLSTCLYTDCVNFTILWNGLEAVIHAQAVDIGPLPFSFMSWQQCCSCTTTIVIFFLFSGRCCCGFFWLWWCCSFVLLLSSVSDVQYSSSTTVLRLTSWELSMAFLCPSQQCSGESGVRLYSWWALI